MEPIALAQTKITLAKNSRSRSVTESRTRTPVARLRAIVVGDFGDHGIRPQRQPSGLRRRGQGGGLRAEISAERAAPRAAVAELARSATDPELGLAGLGKIRHAPDGHVPSGERFLQPFPHFLFHEVHLHRWQKLPIRQLRQAPASRRRCPRISPHRNTTARCPHNGSANPRRCRRAGSPRSRYR